MESITALPDYKAEGIMLSHLRTGFKVYYVNSDDSEKFFAYTAYTPPMNSKGIPHIIEHTVLSGSEKYPVKDPFMLLVRNSCNTFLNALTGVDRTYYPAASTVEKDFENLFSVYTDAVFRPLLREETFMQEGIRIASDGGFHFEGVVFSEMLGEMAEHEYVLSSASVKPLFGDSPYKYESGGDAREICRLTYQEYLDAYRKYYAPANISLFLYGDPSGHGKGAVQPRGAEHSSIPLCIQFYILVFHQDLRIFLDLKAGRITVAGNDPETFKLPFRKGKGNQGRSVPGSIISASRDQLPPVFFF